MMPVRWTVWYTGWSSLRMMVSKETESGSRPAPSIIERGDLWNTIQDVSLESSHICIVDATGRIVREVRVASEPNDLIS
jgi:hypothetical protein